MSEPRHAKPPTPTGDGPRSDIRTMLRDVGWRVPVAAVVIVIAVLAIAFAATGGSGDDTPPRRAPTGNAAPAATPTATTEPTVATTPSLDPAQQLNLVDPVEAAKRVKTFNDTVPGDRVLFEGTVWFWQSFGDDGMDMSVITPTRDPEDDPMSVPTALLTSVERR